MSEWSQWARQFEESPHINRDLSVTTQAATCLAAVIEGPHRRACNLKAEHRSADNYPACEKHKHLTIRRDWKGYLEGA